MVLTFRESWSGLVPPLSVGIDPDVELVAEPPEQDVLHASSTELPDIKF